MASLSSNLRLPLFLSFLMLTASSGCSGSVEPDENEGDGDGDVTGDGDGLPPVGDGDGDGDGDGTPQGCEFGGVRYEPGDALPSVDCNSCFCRGGAVICTEIACGSGGATEPPTTCEFGGVIYQSGETFESDCNTCECSNGAVECTLIACEEPDDQCGLPFEGGDCDAAIPVYWHNPNTGNCEAETYGGCGGNDNRFATLEECEVTCGGAPSGRSCEVNGVTYPDGASNVPDPTSCNTCSCLDGEVSGCTKIGCPNECEEGSAFGIECVSCGPVDECLSIRTGCLPMCQTSEDCAELGGGACIDNLCKRLCA